MPGAFLQRQRQRFLQWWQAPVTSRDRFLGALVGAFGALWIGVLGRALLSPLPISLQALGWWAAGSVVVGLTFGSLFPKAATCMFFPFAMFGGGN